MSGIYRQTAPGFRRMMESRTQKAKDIHDIPNPHDPAERNELAEQVSGKLYALKEGLAKAMKMDEGWSEIIQAIQDEDQLEKESAYYQQFVLSNDKGFLAEELLEEAEQLVGMLEFKLSVLSNPATPPAPMQLPQVAGGQNTSPPPRVPAKLPKVTIPNFDGDALQWAEFWTIFNETVHSRNDLSKTTKFSYLRPRLKGAALEAIDGILSNDDGYDMAVDILKERFDRAQERLVSLLQVQFKKIPHSQTRVVDRRRTLDACEKIFRQLENAGEDLSGRHPLSLEFLRKFPNFTIRDLQRFHQIGPESTLPEMRKTLKAMISSEEVTEEFLEDTSTLRGASTSRSEKSGDGFERPPRERTFFRSDFTKGQTSIEENNSTFAAIRERPMGPASPCYFCNSRHFNSECTKYPTARTRANRLRDVDRCTRCARSHNARQPPDKCNLPVRCFHCRTEDHYGPLCRIRYPDISSGTSTAITLSSNESAIRHPTILKRGDPTAPEPPEGFTAQGLTVLASSTTSSLFQTAKVLAMNTEGESVTCTVRIALDTMSTSTYIVTSKANELRLKSHGRHKIFVKIFGTQRASEVSTNEVQFALVKQDGSALDINAFTIDCISDIEVLPNYWPPADRKIVESWKELPIADDIDDADRTLDILIGADYVWKILEAGKQQVAFPGSELILIPSIFGMMLGGTMKRENDERPRPTMLCIDSKENYPIEIGVATMPGKMQSETSDVDEFFKLETIGISDCPTSSDDDKAIESFNETVYYEHGRYHVKWPFIKEKKALLPENYDLTLKRFRSLTKRFQNEPELFSKYREVIQHQAKNGIIEKVPLDQTTTENLTHYLPHHPVIKESSSTTKVRVVYDASSRASKNDVCLNECMLRGPVLLPNLCLILLRFRSHATVVVSDIEKAYLQVALQAPDRDVTRFLWYERDDVANSAPSNLAIYRFCRVTFGIKPSAFLLGITILKHLNDDGSDLARQVKDDTYADNVISGVDNRSAVDYYHDVKALFARAGMNLQEFCSNNDELMRHIPEHDRVSNRDVKVLGLKWDSEISDTIRIPRSSKFNPFKPRATKRTVLQALASIFDPLGLFQPVMLPAKLLLQRLWQIGTDWDTPIQENDRTEWLSLCETIQQIFSVRIPRFVGNVKGDSRLIVFCDASAKAYGAAIYLRHERATETICNLIFAKSRLAPGAKAKSKKAKGLTDEKSQQISLPRLELLGAVVAANAAKFCREALQLVDMPISLFTDSECVLQWIRSDHALKRFVANRVDTIRAVTTCDFRYINTLENPADYLTRGKTTEELRDDQLWWHGPAWLKGPHEEWPSHNIPPISNDALREIVEKTSTGVIMCHAAINQDALDRTGPLGIDISRFSKLYRLMRTTSAALKFFKRTVFRRLPARSQQKLVEIGPLLDHISDENDMTADDYAVSLNLWVKHVQRKNFANEIEAIQNHANSERVHTLGLQLDNDGMLRAHGRYAKADLPETARFPLLLPPKHPFTTLLIADVHSSNYHPGVAQTLSELRQRFWIPQGRAVVSSVLHRCVVCKKQRTAQPLGLPPMPAYPVERVAQSAPFQYIGIDYFGPMKVRVNEEVKKMWACLYTCLSTRAVHLEAVPDCTPAEFLSSFIRFVARRGCPELIISDNAAQFRLVQILGDRGWRRAPDDPDITTYLAKHGIKWHFIVELAPWQGGHYERLVGVVKSLLKSAVGRRLLTWTDLITMLTEAESIVNSRPITYIHSDINSMLEVLRPIDFLLQRPNAVAPTADFSVRDLGASGKRLATIWKQRQKHLQRLWETWYRQYLVSLRERTQTAHRNRRGSTFRIPREGKIVLLRDDELPRGSWKLARVVRLVIAKDGTVRAAEIKIPTGFIIRRAVNFLYPLEIDEPEAPEARTNTTTQPAVSTRADDNEDDFLGFSTDDVQRTTEALRRFEDPSEAGSDAEQSEE